MLDTWRLRLLFELRSRGTLAAVARAVHQSPSAVSQQLAQLQKDVGVELFRRVGRGVQLTAQGEVLAQRAAEVLDLLERAETDLAASLTSVTGRVRIAVFQSAAIALMPRFLTEMAREHPDLRIELMQSERSVDQYDAWAREFDLMLTHRYPGETAVKHAELHEELLAADRLRLAVPRADSPWSSASKLTDVADAPWAMETRSVSSGRWAQDVCRRAGFEPDIRFDLADLYAQANLVESGNAVAILPNLFARHYADVLRLVELPQNPERRIVTSVRRSLAASPAIVACRGILSRIVSSDRPPDTGPDRSGVPLY